MCGCFKSVSGIAFAQIAATRQEVRNLTVMAMSPDLLPDKLELVSALERSARAEVRMRLKHLKWVKSQSSGTK